MAARVAAAFAKDLLSPERLKAQGYFRPEPVAKLLDEHLDRRADRSRQLWSLLVFSLWSEQSR